MDKQEIWKDIAEYEGLYQVSNFGNVRSLERYITNKNGDKQFYPSKNLKIFWQQIGKQKYGRVVLSKDHKRNDCLVHRLVANAFIENKDNKPFVNHIDNNPMNNHVYNLEWCTHSENMIHAQKQGRLFEAQSSGGKAGSATNKNKMIQKHIDLRGTNVNDWFVLDEELAFKRGKKYYANCRCKCGKEQAIELGRLHRQSVTACKSCNSRWK